MYICIRLTCTTIMNRKEILIALIDQVNINVPFVVDATFWEKKEKG